MTLKFLLNNLASMLEAYESSIRKMAMPAVVTSQLDERTKNLGEALRGLMAGVPPISEITQPKPV